MATAELAENDTIASKFLQQLSKLPYACSSLSPPLSSRDGNIVIRGILSQPIRGPDGGAIAKSIIIKHSITDGVPKIFEEILLNSLTEISSSTAGTSTVSVRTPRLYLYDRETNIQIIEDFTNTIDLKTVLFSADAHNLLLPSPNSAANIGYSLGSWLRSFHTWSSAPEQAFLRAHMWRNDHMRETKYHYTYESILRVLGNYPDLLRGYEKTLRDVLDVIAREFERPFIVDEEVEGYGVIHGDIWSGNILLRSPPRPQEITELFIIDWEFAQSGHRSTDLGQILGDLYERKIYNNLDIPIRIMEGVVQGYGAMSQEMAFRIAVYVGVHLVSYYDRRPRRGPRAVSEDVLVAGLKVGRDFIVKGWQRREEFFRDSALGLLFGEGGGGGRGEGR